MLERWPFKHSMGIWKWETLARKNWQQFFLSQVKTWDMVKPQWCHPYKKLSDSKSWRKWFFSNLLQKKPQLNLPELSRSWGPPSQAVVSIPERRTGFVEKLMERCGKKMGERNVKKSITVPVSLSLKSFYVTSCIFPLFEIQRHLAGLSHEKMWFPRWFVRSKSLKSQPKTKRQKTPWIGDFGWEILRNEDLNFIQFLFGFSKIPKVVGTPKICCFSVKSSVFLFLKTGWKRWYYRMCHKTKGKTPKSWREPTKETPGCSFRPGGSAREDVGCWWTWFFASHGSCKGFALTMGWTCYNHGLCAQLLRARSWGHGGLFFFKAKNTLSY